MTGIEVARVMDDLGGAEFTGLGFVYGPIRVEMGGGIAGDTGSWYITFPGYPELKHRGPFTTPKALRNALRELIVWAIQLGLSMEKIAQSGGE